MTEATVSNAATIEAIVADVKENWTTGGGLTWAGSDVIRQGEGALRFLLTVPARTTVDLQLELESWWSAENNADTGAEGDICGEVCAAIREELEHRRASPELEALEIRATSGHSGPRGNMRLFDSLEEARNHADATPWGRVEVFDPEADTYAQEHRGSCYSWKFNAPPAGKGRWVTV